MTRGSNPICWLLLMAASLGGCSKHARPPNPDESPTSAAAQSSVRNNGSPQTAVTPDNVRLVYRLYGNDDLAIVLIHGWACDASYWSNQIDILKSKYTVMTVDLAGHGASAKNRSDWSMGNYGEDVATVVRQMPNPRVILVGHSMGAVVALEATRRIGDRVIGIIAVDALKSIGLPPMPAREIDTQLAPFKADFAAHTRKFVAESLFTRDADPHLVQKVADGLSHESPEVAIPSLQALLSVDLGPTLADIHVPLYAINSDLSDTDQARIRKTYPDFHATVLDHTGHFPMLEVPTRFNPVLQKDIEQLVADSHR